MPTDEITVTVNERMNVKIESGRSYFELHALPGEDFPALPDLTGGVGFTITRGQLKNSLDRRCLLSLSAISVQYSQEHILK